MLRDEEMLPVYDMDINGTRPVQTKLLRDNSLLGVYDPPRHPYGIATGLSPHPEVTPARRLAYGNDNSSLVRQWRSHSKRPDPVPGVQYAGATSQTIGHARLMKLQHIKDSVQSTKEQEKLSNKHLDIQLTSVTPSAFQRPHARFATGLAQVQSHHNDAFMPPMPRPPLFSAW